jgi:hypothetical protein
MVDDVATGLGFGSTAGGFADMGGGLAGAAIGLATGGLDWTAAAASETDGAFAGALAVRLAPVVWGGTLGGVAGGEAAGVAPGGCGAVLELETDVATCTAGGTWPVAAGRCVGRALCGVADRGCSSGKAGAATGLAEAVPAVAACRVFGASPAGTAGTMGGLPTPATGSEATGVAGATS